MRTSEFQPLCSLVRPGRHLKRRSPSVPTVLGVVASLAVGGALALPAGPAAAADPCLEPIATEINVSQGLPSYDKLVRGKTTLVKTFLSERASSGGCAVIKTASIYVTGGAVTVSNGTAATSLVVPGGTSLPALPVNGTTIAPNSPADPVFTLAPDKIVPPASGSTLTFTARIDYVTKSDSTGATLQTGSVTLSTLPGSTTPISRTLAAPSRPLRVLAVPLGDAASATPQFPAEAQSTLQNAMLAASRILPVADGVGDIAGTTGGLRYATAAGLVNLGVHDEPQADGSVKSVNYMPSGSFCGSAASFSYIRQKLSDFRLAWNTEHPTAPADRVLGVAWQGLSTGPTTTAGSTCAEGYAAVNGAEAWVRLAEPAAGSPSGGVAALELNHTYGGVVGSVGYHSGNTAADGTAVGRAFNTTTLRQLGDARSALRFDVSGWDNYSTLYEKRDWDFTLCMLASTASPATECGSSTTGGTTAPAGGGFVLSGSTDLTAAGTDAHTRFDPDPPTDGTNEASSLRLALLDSTGTVLANTGVRTSNVDSAHSQAETGAAATTNPTYGFDVAIAGPKTFAFELWKGAPYASGSVKLYRRELNAAPVIGDVTIRQGASTPARFTTDGASSAPSVGGQLVAVSRGGSVVLSSLTSPAPLATVPGQSGRLDESGSTLVVTDNGDVTTYSVSVRGSTVTLGAPTTVYTGGGTLAPGAASSPVLVGSTAVFTAAGDLYAVDTTSPLLPASSALCGIGEALPLPLPGNPCSRWTATPAVERAGSFSTARGLLAYTSSTGASPSVWTLATSAPTTTAVQRVAAVSDPAWVGDLLLVSGTQGLQAVDATTYAVPSRITAAPGDSQAAASGAQVFFTRPAGASSDVYRLSLDRKTLVVPVTDEMPATVRLDIYADCGQGADPLVTATRPTSVSGSTATTEVLFSTDRSCASPTVVIDATDGYSVTQKRLPPTTGSRLASAAIYSPKDGSTLLSYEPIVLAGEATGDFVYTLTGPAGSAYATPVVVSSGASPRALVAPPAGGFTPGAYTVRLSTSGIGGTYTAVARVTVLADSDGDGIPDTEDTRAARPCYPADALTSTVNASTDYDNDLLISLIDPDPCVSALNATVDFDANSVNVASSGTSVTVYVTSTAFDLRRLTASATRIVQLGAYPLNLVATNVTNLTATTATLKFSRQDLQNAYLARGLTGYQPVLITGAFGTATFKGFDPDAPVFSP